jgi:hypothetical protein
MPRKTSSSRELGCLAPAVGIAGLVATLMLGPIDLGRSVYNQIIGDTPILKRELLDYSRRDIQSKNRQYTPQQVETALADELGYSLDGDRIHPLDVSIEELWDASEDHARSLYQRWVWPSLDE